MANSRHAERARPAGSGDAGGDRRVCGVFAGCGLALVAARHVVPAESAHLGETLWIAEAWLLLATAWMLLRHRGIAPRIRLDRGDLATALLVGGHVIAAGGVLLSGGHRRAALNLLWEWVAIGIAVVLLRHWLTRSGRWPLLWSVLTTAGIVLSGLGVWQFAVTYPALRTEVEELTQLEGQETGRPLAEADARRLQQLRMNLGSLATEAAPSVRDGLRQRLMASTEPLACFALANTLAGVLSVALLLLLRGLATSLSHHEGTPRAVRITVPATLVAACLVLTKSRTAWMGLLMGLAAWGEAAARGRWMSRRNARIVLIGLLAAAVLIGVGWTAGALDRLVLLEAPKSFRYRLEYWTGAWGVIRDHFWIGVGPGNFRQSYLRHKVAGSSEEILDPHNMFLDVWANGGVMALAGLLLAGSLAVRRWRSIVPNIGSAEEPTPSERDDRADSVAARRSTILCGGGGIGLVLLKSGLLEYQWDERLFALLLGWVVAAMLLPPLRINPAVQMAAGIALGVHLLGAGGIAMPVVVITLLLLWLGPTTQHVDPAPQSDAVDGRGSRWALAGFLLFAALTPACLFSAVIPVTLSSLYVAAATGAMAQRGDAAMARRYLNDAKQADALDPQPWIYFAQLEHDSAVQTRDGTSERWMAPIALLSPAIALDPENPKMHWLDAQWRLEFVERFPSPALADEAVLAAQRAAERDPQHSGIVATLAGTYAAANRPEEARQAAERALALDALNRKLGHYDKLLDDARRAELTRISGE